MKAAAAKPKRRFWRKLLTVVLWTLTLVSAAGLLAASFCGDFPPVGHRGFTLIVMTFPLWLVMMIFSTVLDIFWCRKALLICVPVYVACAQAIWDFTPLNVFKPSMSRYASVPKFTFLTYNVTNFSDLTDAYPAGINPTVEHILALNADVVNLQEAAPIEPDKRICLTSAQCDSLYRAYPYIISYSDRQMLLSKYPAQSVHTEKNRGGHEIAVFRLNIEGLPVTLFDVHLASFRLTDDDKELYQDVTRLNDEKGSIKSTLIDVRSQLFAKVQKAAEERQEDCDRLCRYIERFGGPNVIVAGDFNDVPCCYTLRRLRGYDLRQVYPELGFGPMITFNRDRFYFRIDHILWRGALKPLRLWRGSYQESDHYPQLVTFAITE